MKTRDEAIGSGNEVCAVLAATTIRDLPTEGDALRSARRAGREWEFLDSQ